MRTAEYVTGDGLELLKQIARETVCVEGTNIDALGRLLHSAVEDEGDRDALLFLLRRYGELGEELAEQWGDERRRKAAGVN